MLKELLESGKCFKLVCGAGNEDVEEVERLVALYSAAGCKFFDLSAKPEIINAAVTFGEIGQNVAESAKGVAKGITLAGYATGAGMGVWGCVDMYKATKNQGQSTYAGGLTKVVIGALALGLGEFLGSGSATLFGSDQTSGMGELGL